MKKGYALRNKELRAGYSLVEISLALLVVGVGLLAVLGLFPEGLGTARRAVDDVEVAAFAEFVFASLTLEARDFQSGWSGFSDGLQLLPTQMLDPGNQPIIEVANNKPLPSKFLWYPNHYAFLANQTVSEHATAHFTYSLEIDDKPQTGLRYARLEVWAGEYPEGTVPSTPGKVFYREFLPIK